MLPTGIPGLTLQPLRADDAGEYVAFLQHNVEHPTRHGDYSVAAHTDVATVFPFTAANARSAADP